MRQLKGYSLAEVVAHGVIVAVPIILLLALTWYNLAPSGTLTVAAEAGQSSPYINRILPAERAVASSDGQSISLVDDPTYFTALVPRGGFTKAEVTIDYRNHGQPIFKLGVITDMMTNSFDLRLLANFVVDDNDWQESTVTFDTADLPQTKGTIKFILSTPQIKANQHSLDIKRIKIVWHK